MADLMETGVEGYEQASEAPAGHPFDKAQGLRPGGSCDQFSGGRCLLAAVQAAPVLCIHCLGDPTGLFRGRLGARAAQRELAVRLAAGGDAFPCDRFSLQADSTFCTECRRNPALQQMLGGKAPKKRKDPCIRRREQVGEAEVRCCGGKTKMVPAYRCAQETFTTESTENAENDKRKVLGVNGEVPLPVSPFSSSAPSAPSAVQSSALVVSVHSAVERGLVTEQDCARCPEYQGQSAGRRTETQRTRAEGREGNGQRQETGACASWEKLWQCHKGKTALILACGPSVLLPGEDPSPDTVDPRGLVKRYRKTFTTESIEGQEKMEPQRPQRSQREEREEAFERVKKNRAVGVLPCSPAIPSPWPFSAVSVNSVVQDADGLADVVVSTNWAWKWYADIIDYQVSYDPTPCLGWRPAGIKLLTPVRPKATMAALGGAHVYCFFPQCDYGDIAQGKALPCSRNSGYAALAFAAYAGCSRILVLGMDFGPREDSSSIAPQEGRRMHFYHESKGDVDRRVRSFGRQKERVQGDLTKLLAAVRATGATVENLSPRSELKWG